MKKYLAVLIALITVLPLNYLPQVNAAEPVAEADAELPGISFVSAEHAAQDKAKPPSQRYNIEEGDILFISINQKAQSGSVSTFLTGIHDVLGKKE